MHVKDILLAAMVALCENLCYLIKIKEMSGTCKVKLDNFFVHYVWVIKSQDWM